MFLNGGKRRGHFRRKKRDLVLVAKQLNRCVGDVPSGDLGLSRSPKYVGDSSRTISPRIAAGKRPIQSRKRKIFEILSIWFLICGRAAWWLPSFFEHQFVPVRIRDLDGAPAVGEPHDPG